MELSKLNGTQPNQSSHVGGHHNYADVNALNDLRTKAREDQKSALRPVAEQFEAIFVQQILKEARNVSFDDNWLDGNQGEFYKDWYDKQLSLNLSSKGTLGFADNIVEQLSQSIPEVTQAKQEKPVQNNQTQDVVENTVLNSTESTEQALALRFTQPL